MAKYTIKYLNGDVETVEADSVECDVDARDYTFKKTDVGLTALVPIVNIRSVVRQDDETATN